MKEHPRCWIQLLGRKLHECEVSHGCFPAVRSSYCPAGKLLVYEPDDVADKECTLFYFGAKIIYREGDIFGAGNINGLSVANLKLVFCINFPGRASDEKIIIRRKVPIVRRGQGW
jgi:hypothetical protein